MKEILVISVPSLSIAALGLIVACFFRSKTKSCVIFGISLILAGVCVWYRLK